jgi:hypothetical protein
MQTPAELSRLKAEREAQYREKQEAMARKMLEQQQVCRLKIYLQSANDQRLLCCSESRPTANRFNSSRLRRLSKFGTPAPPKLLRHRGKSRKPLLSHALQQLAFRMARWEHRSWPV